jgi:divalent metal cation (Fe/Co/Zn/Cd) transporter
MRLKNGPTSITKSDAQDPTLRAVFVEDLVAISGDVIAFAALALTQITGSEAPQGVAAVLIAVVMIRISLRLIQRSHDFLVGAWAFPAAPAGRDPGGFTQPLRPTDEARARAFLLGFPGVTAVRELLFTFVGPGQVWAVARVEVDNRLLGSEIASLAREIESGMKHQSEGIYRVDVVPIGAEHVGGPRFSLDRQPDRHAQRAHSSPPQAEPGV